MNEVQTATAHFDTDVLSRSECHETGLLINKLNGQQIFRICILLHDSIPTTVFHILLIEAGLIDLIVFGQRAIGVQEAVVGCDENAGAAEFIANDTNDVLDFVNGIIAGWEYQVVSGVACLIHLIVVDVDFTNAWRSARFILIIFLYCKATLAP